MHTSCVDEIAGDETAVRPVPQEPSDGAWWVIGPQVLASHPEWDYLFDGSRSALEPAEFPAGWLDQWFRDAAAGITHGTDRSQIFQWADDAHVDVLIEEARALGPDYEAEEHAERSEKLARALKDAGAVLGGPAPEPPVLVALPGSAEPGGPEDGPADDGPAAA